jgi:colicin import membrane protein
MNWTADRDEPGKVASGVLAVVVHLAFFALLVIGLRWQHRAPEATQVDLWNSLPPVPQVKTPPVPQPKIEPKPEVKPPPPPPPQPKVEAKPKPVPEPKPEAKPDIALEKEKQEKARQERARQEKLEAIKREQAAKAEERKREEAEKQKLAALERDRRQKELERERLEREQAEAVERLRQQQAAANSKMMDEYRKRISDKIQRYVVGEPCKPLGANLMIPLSVVILPDGNLLGEPRLTGTSGSAACDDAVRRAAVRAQPLPLPEDPALRALFRNLILEFRPNG